MRHFWRSQSNGVVADMAKAAAAIGFLSLVAATWLAATIDLGSPGGRTNLPRPFGGEIQKADPLVTGSLLRLPNGPRLDPCAGERRN